ncbi:alanyl (membrane) aminopeptidase a [Alosa sapidissima]|uniref:alanyl (membrane) aminopeptidase a n=1 Tax=Alosa sapidissima TaxID=34773 RepID=UPI001C08BF3D|nr:alanyl (membrane) aminopeptidase a [Alosa sapidissima]
MAKGLFMSTGLAVGTGIMTLSALGGIITMAIIFQVQVGQNPPTTRVPITTTPVIPTGPPPDLRLPRNVIPQRYHIFLRPLFYHTLTNETIQSFIFMGNSTVTFECLNKTRSIFLHSKDLTVKKLELTRLDNGDILTVNQHVNESTVSETDFLEVKLEDDAVLEPNRSYSLFADFEGEMFNDLTGFYTSTYEVENSNETRYLGATQMAATDARKVFPCFDEPDLKANFSLTLTHREGSSALANWPKKRTSGSEIEIDGEKWVVTEFQSTKKMSTYLMAFVVSELANTGGIDHKVWARPEAITDGHAKYADTVANKILNFYESELGLKYPVGKLDHIALPDLAPAGMENWGLITYRESALLFAEGVSSTFDKEYIATLIAHQLAHQWFGNLVTMKWWNDLWLSEGFATYMSYQGLKHLEPSWNTEDLFVVNEVQRAFQVDALTAAYPLSPSEEEIQSLSEINGLFDTITYSKGAAVLRMLSHYMSTGSFKEGIKKYLKALEYESADQYDLWTYLQEADTNIEEIMSTWTTQAGYPVLTVNTGTGDISQERFLLNSTGNKAVVWHVPINLLKNDGSEVHDLLLDKAIGGPRPELKRDKWIVVNINCTGYYRVNYDRGNWEGLMAQQKADHHAIPMINRAQLIDDAFNLARGKYIDVTLALNTTKYLKNETEYIPWNAAMKNLKYFILMFDRSEVYGPMQTYLKDQITNLYRHFEHDTMNNTVPKNHLDQYAQLEAVTVACKVGLKECIDTATNMFNQWKENPYNTTTQIHPNLRYNVYCYAIADGGQAEWEFAWEKYLNSTIAAEKDKLRYGLSCTRHIWLLNRYLQYTLDPTKIRKIDTVSTINYIASNVAGQALAWDFVRGNWKHFSEEHGGEIKFLGDLIDGVTERFSTEYELQQLKQFQYDSDLTGDSIGSASRALERAIERTQINIQWVKDNKDTVLDWFRSETK